MALLPLATVLPKEGNHGKGRVVAYNKARTNCICASVMPCESGDSWEDWYDDVVHQEAIIASLPI